MKLKVIKLNNGSPKLEEFKQPIKKDDNLIKVKKSISVKQKTKAKPKPKPKPKPQPKPIEKEEITLYEESPENELNEFEALLKNIF